MMNQHRIITLSRYLPYQEGLGMANNEQLETVEKPLDFLEYIGNPTNKLILHSFDYLVKEYNSKPFLETIVYQFTKVLVNNYDMERCELVKHSYEKTHFSITYLNKRTDTSFTIMFSYNRIVVLGEFTELFHYQAAFEFLYSRHIAYGLEEGQYYDKEKFASGIYQNPVTV